MHNFKNSVGYNIIINHLTAKGFSPFAFQQQAWQHIASGNSGIVNAPTGCGKTYSVFLGGLINFINANKNNYTKLKNNGLQILWVTPLKALAKDIARAMQEVVEALEMPWRIGIRNGDTDTSERQKQKRNMPEILIITPESLQLLLAQKDNNLLFKTLQIIAVDEWHELMGGKRGVQMELAIAFLLQRQQVENSVAAIKRNAISVWGISATIGNLDEAGEVLLYALGKNTNGINIIKANLKKRITVQSIIPEEVENYPWAGHLGIKLAPQILPIIGAATTTLVFINTRGMTETWYQNLLILQPELAGAIALHHGSMEQALRTWVEDALHTAILKVVVCTASLDLGVDFRPVETVIQVGSPKGIARFLQRAGRSGHQPNAESKIYFLPTHSLELLEAAALKDAIANNDIESKMPLQLCFDVLIQFLCTLAVGEGFEATTIFNVVKNTYCYQQITWAEFIEVISYITHGGSALHAYDEYKKVELHNGIYAIKNKKIAMHHRMHIGTIVSDAMLKVKFISGGFIGVIEEYFISKVNIGDSFTLAGRNLELVAIKDMMVQVKLSTSKKTIVPSWMGGRMSLSSNLSNRLRAILDHATSGKKNMPPEIVALQPLLQLQQQLSAVPKLNEILIEHIENKEGYHLFVYSFEGRGVNEAMAALLGYRLSKLLPITFSFAMNDYGFELLSDTPIPLDDSNVYEMFTSDDLYEDIQQSVNSTEMSKRKFRDIAVIGGLIFQGVPGEQKKARHLQNSASLLYKVLKEYEPNNLLLRQANTEVLEQQMEEGRLRKMLQRIQNSKIIITYPKQYTPFCFPLKVDSIRENMSSEKLADRIKKMQKGF